MNEHVLLNHYPVYAGYWYVIDGKPKQSPITSTVGELKKHLNAKEIRRCDIVGRNSTK